MTKIEHDVVLFSQGAATASKSLQHPRTAHSRDDAGAAAAACCISEPGAAEVLSILVC